MPNLPQGLFPDDCVDRTLLKQAVYKCMTDGSYYHEAFRHVFLAAGFVVRRVEREPYHPVWKVKLLRGTFELASESVQAARQIRRLLKVNRFAVDRDGVSVVLNGNYVTCSFVSTFGWEGALNQPEDFV